LDIPFVDLSNARRLQGHCWRESQIWSALNLFWAAAARGAQAAQVDGDGKAEEESAKGIEPIVIEGYVLAEDPRHQAEYKSQVGELQQAAVFRIEAAI
jgi:hypothetical protein